MPSSKQDSKGKLQAPPLGRATRPFELDERTYLFAKDVRTFLRGVPRSIANLEDGKQLIRSSGSIGANYIEANENLSKKDFKLRLRIARKEAKESAYWLRLLHLDQADGMEASRESLRLEAMELVKIFSSILNKAT